MEKKCKKAKWLSEEALQIAMKRREAKSNPLSKQAIFMQAYRYFSGYEYLIDCHNRQLYMNSSLERMSQIFSFIKNK